MLFIFLLLVAGIVNAANIDKEIENRLNNNEEVHVIVKLKNNPRAEIKAEQSKVLSRLNLKEKRIFGILTEKPDFKLNHQYSTVNGFSGKLTNKGLEKLRNDPDVEFIYLDKKFSITLDTSISKINADDAWNLQLNSKNITGSGETICIIDTGVDYNHSSLGNGWGNKVINGYRSLNNGADKQECSSNPSACYDDEGHGTHVAGIIASDNETYRGVAYNAKIIAVKVLDSSGSGWASDIIAGIDWCTSNASKFNISVISMSLGDCSNHSTYCNNDPLAPSINAAAGKNITVMVAAGNGPGGSCTGISNTAGPSSPACVENATAVGAVNDADSISYQRGALFELLAPGVSICSSRLPGDSDGSSCGDGTFILKSGTSMSTPHASGAAALIQQFNKLQNQPALTPLQLKQVFNDTGKVIDDSAGSGYKFSRINIFAAIQSLDAVPPDINIISPQNNTQTFNTTILINATAEDYLNNISSCILQWNNINESMTKSSQGKSVYCYKTKSITGTGNFNYKVYADDSENNLAESESRQITINNTSPNITSFYPAAADISIIEPENQFFNITYEDINNQSINVTWYKDGNTVSSEDNYTFIGNYSAQGSYNITVIINDSSLTDSMSWNLTVNNTYQAPQEIEVTLISTDSLNRTNGTLIGSWTLNQNQTDNETRWYKNNIEISAFADLTSIPQENTTKNQEWIFSARVYDNTTWGNWTNSSVLMIKNTPPEMQPLSDININAADLINITVTASDLDNDNLTYYINNTNFNQTDNNFIWNTTIDNAGTYTVEIKVSDDSSNTSQSIAVNICLDQDGDGYGPGCLLGEDFNDNDSAKYAGASCSRTCYSGSAYSAAGDCTGGSYTCSSGGGGGGSSSSSGAIFAADLEKNQYRNSLRNKDKVNFKVKSMSHSATVSAVYTNSVDLVVQSAPLLVTVYKSETAKLDMDNDAVYDLAITLNDIINSKADLTFNLIEEPMFPEIFFEEETAEEEILQENITEEIIEEPEVIEPAEEQPAYFAMQDEADSSFDISFLKESTFYIVLTFIALLSILLVVVRFEKKRFWK